MLTVESHEYDVASGIDTYVFNPGNMKAKVKVIDEGDGPEVLLGVEGMAVQQDVVGEPSWTVCANQEIVAIALEEYNKRKAAEK